MKVIIPLAGKGTRLRPHTHLVPKPMLKVAGKPVIEPDPWFVTSLPGGTTMPGMLRASGFTS